MSEKKKNYYSSRQAAELLSVAVSTVQLWTNNGLLRAWTTVGGHRRIERSSVDDMLAQQAITMRRVAEPELSIVIVEDSLQQLRLYEKQFKARHVKTTISTASNGYEGLIKIGQILPDVIITDLVMPKMDGFQMVAAIKEMDELADSLIIVVSGLSEDEVKLKGGLPDGVNLLTKPIAFEKLEALLQQKIKTKAA